MPRLTWCAGRSARLWAAGGEPDDLPRIAPVAQAADRRREVYLYFISAAKERNPHAAMALQALLRER